MIPTIQIFEDTESLSRAAASLFLEETSQAIEERRRALISLCGGNTPLRLYELLGTEFRKQVRWERIHFFWGDERCVPVGDPGNSYGQARGVFLDEANVPAQNIQRINSDLEPDEASKEYALTLKSFAESPYEWPRFDLVLLGLGEDGHIASLFPGSPLEVSAPVMAVTADYQGRPAHRVTLTPKVFNAARQIVFLVTGENKADILARVLDNESYQPELYPAQRIHPLGGKVTWLLDRLAASKLPREMKLKFCEG